MNQGQGSLSEQEQQTLRTITKVAQPLGQQHYPQRDHP